MSGRGTHRFGTCWKTCCLEKLDRGTALYFEMDVLALATGLCLVLLAPLIGKRTRFLWRRGFGALARRRYWSIGVVVLVSLAVNATTVMLAGVPHPSVQDEFSYLLGADTFAQGRVTNVRHPLWEHFESFHIIQLPTYQSKFPPGQALFLALGQVLCGRPIVGAWISSAAAAGATCWMLQAWTRPRWALLAGIVVAMHPRIMLLWTWSYWGGSVAMLGGALLFGALRRLVTSRPRVSDSLVLASGLVVLANTRPYEGLVAALPAAVLLAGWLLSSSGCLAERRLTHVVAPVLLVLVAAAIAMCYWNYRVTGFPYKHPYQAWVELYGPRGHVSDLLFRFGRMEHQGAQRAIPLPSSSTWNIGRTTPIAKLGTDWLFYAGPLLSLPIFALLVRTPRGWIAFALFTFTLTYMSYILLHSPPRPHYTAPVACLFFLFVAQGLRHLHACRWRGLGVGQIASGAIAAAVVIAFVLATSYAVILSAAYQDEEQRPWHMWRNQLASRLAADGHQHLIVVRYGNRHRGEQEWVYNAADIDASPLVWARELTPEKNRRLLEYYRNRTVWLLEADLRPPRLTLHVGSRHQKDPSGATVLSDGLRNAEVSTEIRQPQ